MSRNTSNANPFTFQGFDSTTELLRGPVKAKKGPSDKQSNSGGAGMAAGANAVATFIKRAAAIAKRTPEAMVRITGAAKGKDHVKEHLAYITRNGKLDATNERGETISGRLAVKDVAEEWTSAGLAKNGPDTRNVMLSMPKGTDPEKVLRAAKTFADKTFGGERQYMIALHTDKDHPHVHLTLKREGFDGKNLNPRKADLQQWREGFAHELRALGIAAEATPRRARGVVKKPKVQAVYHIEKRHQAGTKRRDGTPYAAPDVQLKKYADAVKEITGSAAPKVRPWELKIRERQEKVRGAWLHTAAVLDKHPSDDAKQLAKQIRAFVKDMPLLQTERQQIHAQVAKGLGRGVGKQPDKGADRS